jgi:hypothetical protein
MLGKFVVMFGILLSAAVLFQAGSFVAGQDDSMKQKSIQQMREIANAMKQCPTQRVVTKMNARFITLTLGHLRT